MNDSVADLLDHPPHDPSPVADPRFTAAVMGRVALLPPVGAAAPARPIWWLAAAVLAIAAFALPGEISPDAVNLVAPVVAGAPGADENPVHSADSDADGTVAMLAPFTDPTVLIDGVAGALALGAGALILRAVTERRTALRAESSLVNP